MFIVPKCLQIPFVGVITYATSAESLFLEDKWGIEVGSTLFCRLAEVEVAAMGVIVVDELMEEQVESPMRLPLC